MLPDEVREAVEYMDDLILHYEHFESSRWAAIKAYLLAREAEVEKATRMRDHYEHCAESLDKYVRRHHARAERAEALLREVVALLHPDTDEHNRITAHLSENSRG